MQHHCFKLCLLKPSVKDDFFTIKSWVVFDLVSINESQNTLQKKGKMENYLPTS